MEERPLEDKVSVKSKEDRLIEIISNTHGRIGTAVVGLIGVYLMIEGMYGTEHPIGYMEWIDFVKIYGGMLIASGGAATFYESYRQKTHK